MTFLTRPKPARRRGRRSARPHHNGRNVGLPLVIGALAAAFSLTAVPAIAAPASPTTADKLAAFEQAHAQHLHVSGVVDSQDVARDGVSATPPVATFTNDGTNFAWARLVMLDGGWPASTNNVTVFTRWMRQENGPNNWWNRNNPLNNGYGSGGGSGLGSYATLQIAAAKAAENLHHNPGCAQIAADFAASADPSVTAAAIWASPWSTSHYANGAHWSTAPVQSFKAPASAWG